MYKRLDVYPDGTKIPESLPDRYQSILTGNVPDGQKCLNCKHYNSDTKYCNAFNALVRSQWWCAVWEPVKLTLSNSMDELVLLKKITTNTIEEQFSKNYKKPSAENLKIKDITNVVNLDAPLVMKLLEFTKDPANANTELTIIVENLLDLLEDNEVLTIKDYPSIVKQ
jgi:hypothetical protein